MISRTLVTLTLSLGALLFVGCTQPRLLEPAEPRAETGKIAVVADAGMDAAGPDAAASGTCLSLDGPEDEGVGGPWVRFHGGPYEGDYGSTNGPHWWFGMPGLPALSRDGERILAFNRDDSLLGAEPGADLVVKRIADGTLISSRPLLDMAAFRAVHDLWPDDDGRRRGYDGLKAKVIEDTQRLNGEVTGEGWQALTRCRVDIETDETQPACSMKEQTIQCGGGVRLVYREPQLEIFVQRHRSVVRNPRWLARPVLSVEGDPDSKVEVRGCVGAAWYEPARAIIVLSLSYTCRAAGDWCSPPGRWDVVKLRAAPPPEPPRTATSAGCEKGMMSIPAGSFVMGSADDGVDEQPPHAKKVDAFCLDTTEVTVGEYRACLNAGRCFTPDPAKLVGPGSYSAHEPDPACNWGSQGRDGHPMNCVPYVYAEEYCDWAKKRLPTEAEWEYAARGPQDFRYPWGNGDPGQGVCWNRPNGGTCAATSGVAEKSPFGVTGMAANVREWTSTPYARYNGCGRDGGQVVRGGEWKTTSAAELRATRRLSVSPTARDSGLGFRCAMTR